MNRFAEELRQLVASEAKRSPLRFYDATRDAADEIDRLEAENALLRAELAEHCSIC